MTEDISKAEAKRLLDITDENGDFEGISRPGMMLRQNVYFAHEEIDRATAVSLSDDGYQVVLHAVVDGRVASWNVHRRLIEAD